MARLLLQDMIDDLRFEDLPPNWNSFDIPHFSKNKTLWDYQQKAIENAIKLLWKYYEDFQDYQKGERLETNQIRKEKLYQWYRQNGLEEDLDIPLDKRKRDIYNLLTEYYPTLDGKIPYKHFINRMSFWMATGSGKTLVIIKLIQILSQLMERKEIPLFDILVLTHRDDLIQQLKRHIEEFNSANEKRIIPRELKEYPSVKREQNLLSDNSITIFFYRSDNLNDEQKEKILDFRNYDNEGKWFIFLDEAHKGDKEESKRQHIYSILSRNGFLFNTSATFTDPRDIITCVKEFNLSSFLSSGYGKHISILKQEIRAFRDDEDYSEEEKQKIVLKSLILLTYNKMVCEKIRAVSSQLYHKPMLLTLVNSVNTEDADLKLFFREIQRIGKGEIEEEVFQSAKEELWRELREKPKFMFEDKNLNLDEKLFHSIKPKDVLRYVFNAEGWGGVEVLRRAGERKELAFKLKTSDRPFALIKIGDVTQWLKEEFVGYEVQERFEEESYFENLNREDSEINILMGSRGFYEGWDSNRPNVINFINIGMGEDARKFILQSVGRGVRIEPISGKRKRLLELYNGKEIEEKLFEEISSAISPHPLSSIPLEILFIFGTNRNALETVIQELDQEERKEGELQLSLFPNLYESEKAPKLLVPTYKSSGNPILKTERRKRIELSEEDLGVLERFMNLIDDRVLLMRYSEHIGDMAVEKLKFLRDSLRNKDEHFSPTDRRYKMVDVVVQRILDYLNVVPEELDRFKVLEEEIRHFKNVKVYIRDVKEVQELKKKIEEVKSYPDKKERLKAEIEKLSPEVREEIKSYISSQAVQQFTYNNKTIKIKYVANHYYIPLILSEEEKIDYIKHIIKTKSEADFIEELERYLAREDNKFKEFDWWMFSKIDESMDKVYIPYYNPNDNKISNFYPDFIFWLKRGEEYYIIFVDPKGTEHTSAMRKIDGYKEIFEEDGKEKIFYYEGLKVKVKAYLKVKDKALIPSEYQRYAFDDIEDVLRELI
ncbi:DEAD/DEAH box helicase family protein [bacterium]|nr:DEAD/DEAH box helicase family protein [bacterium]